MKIKTQMPAGGGPVGNNHSQTFRVKSSIKAGRKSGGDPR